MVEEDGTPPATLRSSMGQSKGFQIASTAGTYADAEHVQTAEDAVDEAEKVFNQKHHTSKAFTGEDVSKGALATCLNSSRFESILSFVICLNMILIIAETDLTADGQEPPGWITSANLSFLAVYFVECVLKIWVFRWSYFQDTWNWLDLLVVVSDSCLTSLNFFSGTERVSVIRVFRLVKLSRAVRVIRQIWELKILLLGFKAAAKSIFFGMGMVLVMTMVWAILGVQLIHPIQAEIWADTDCEWCKGAFGSVWNASLTIFMTVVAADNWGEVAIPIIDRQPWTFLWFLIVLVTVQLAMLNLILAVIVERAADAREKEERRAILEKEDAMHKSKLRLIQLCRELDTDKNGRLSEDEFLDGFENNPHFAEALLGMGVYPEDISLLFDVLDTQGSGEITYISFVNTLARLRTQMSQVILFSITELRKTVSQLQSRLGTGSARQPQFGNPNIGVDGDNVKTLIQSGESPEQGIDEILARQMRQMEEMNREMQLRFQQMHLEISSSFHNALRISIELNSLEKAQQDEISSEFRGAEEAYQLGGRLHEMFPASSDFNASRSSNQKDSQLSPPVLVSDQLRPTLLGCCDATLSPETMSETNATIHI